MRMVILSLLLAAAALNAWNCPNCLQYNEGSFCSECYLPETPSGMVFVPSSTVTIQGEEIHVPAFFIDQRQVSYRDVLQWLNNSGFSAEELGLVITGSTDASMQFLAFTPFIGDNTGGITVPSTMLDRPAASITWNGAQTFLAENGRRLPTLAEMTAAHEMGLILAEDSFQAMQGFSEQMRMSMGDMLGTLAAQAMFAGYSTASERVMWELTGTVFNGDPLETALLEETLYITLFKALEEPLLSASHRNNGYFNILFRGAIEIPGF